MIKMSQDEFHEFVNQSELSLVQFSANWCGPCKMLTKTLESMEQTQPFRVAKIDIDEERELVQSFGIRSVPTMIIFKDGKEVKRMVGNKTQNAIEDFMEVL
jgi:thioredoxin 1